MGKIYQQFHPAGKNAGFTLIELLVVVLIIGILAAIALPQYEKAVAKARMTEGIMAVEEIARANRMYYMANGQYSRDINDLDVSYTGNGVYGNSIPANIGKNFIFTASAWGRNDMVALVSRRANDQDTSGEKVYSLAIDKNGNRVCALYGKATAYERQLCTEWAAGGNVWQY